MKKKLSTILGRIAIVAIFAGCVEAADGSITVWTFICLGVALISGLLSNKLEGAR